MTDKMANAPKDGRQILIVDRFGEFAVVYWSKAPDNGKEFGWTFDGGDRYEPVDWSPLPPDRLTDHTKNRLRKLISDANDRHAAMNLADGRGADRIRLMHLNAKSREADEALLRFIAEEI